MIEVVVGEHGEAYAESVASDVPWALQVVALVESHRRNAGVSVEELARRVDGKPLMVQRQLQGRVPVTLHRVEALAAALGLRLEVPEVGHVR